MRDAQAADTVVPTPFTVRGQAGTLAGDVWEPRSEPVDEILMLHGGAQTRHSWNRAARRLVDSGYRVTTMDARGHGDSDWAPDGDYDIHRMSEDLVRIVEQRFPDRSPVLVGASLGGLTGLLALGQKRDVARALVLVDVTPKLEVSGVERVGEFLNSGAEGFESLEQVADLLTAYQPHRKRPGNLDGLRKNLRQRDDGRWYWHWDPAFARNANGDNAELGNDFFADIAPEVSQPVLLIRGGRSDIVSDDSVSHLLEIIPHAYTQTAAEAGHMVAGDDNAVFLDQLEWFLEEVLSERGRIS